MTDKPRAADLPDRSIVSGERTTYIKDHPTATAAWRGTRGGHHRDWEVDEALDAGAQVLRVGHTDQPATLRLADVADTLIGAVENGSWVLIADLNLRKVVGEYIADTCHSIALDAGLDEAMEVAHDATPQRLDTTSRLVGSDARERLARHLFLRSSPAEWRDHDALRWDQRSETIDFDAVYAEADALLAVITGQEN